MTTTINGTTGIDTSTVDATALEIEGNATEQILQTVSSFDGEVATTTTTMPMDDTIPQNTEGAEFLSVAITPKSASSRLEIDVTALVSSSNTNNATVALFQDGVTGALSATLVTLASNYNAGMQLKFSMVSGVTSEITFTVRIGLDSAGTLTFNGRSSGRFYGGIANSGITIREIV